MSDNDRGFGLSEDETMDALGELYREGKVDMVPVLGEIDPEEQPFTMTDGGMEYARELFHEKDEAVLMLVGLVVKGDEPYDSARDLAQTLVEFAEWFVDESDVNPLRVINRNIDDVPFITEKLPSELVEYYDTGRDP